MDFHIRILPDQTAQLVSPRGETLMTFTTISQARLTCKDWYYLPEMACAATQRGDDGHFIQQRTAIAA